jgi:hypothetical protein
VEIPIERLLAEVKAIAEAAIARGFAVDMHGARFPTEITLEDAIGSHACSLEVNIRVTNSIPLRCQLPLTVSTINFVQTLKASS